MSRAATVVRVTAALAWLSACQPSSAPEPDAYDWGLPAGVEPPPVPDDNPPTVDKVELGRHLFYDLRLSKNENRACGTCHEQAKAFTDGFHRAVGTDNDMHGHNTISLVNVGYRSALGWADLQPRALEQQLFVPLLGDDPVEMGMAGREQQLLDVLADDPVYVELFAAAFPEHDQPFTLPNLALAIAAFERTILSVDAPLDRYLRGQQDAISPAAVRGWQLFQSEQLGCLRCHGGRDFDEPLDYYNIGLYDIDGEGSYPDSAQGLIEQTGEAADMGRFRTPTLRNLAYTKPYMHDGSVISLTDVVDIFAAGGRNVQSGPFVGDGRTNPHKSELIQPIELSATQRADLVEMLLALSDDGLVTDPRLSSPWVD